MKIILTTIASVLLLSCAPQEQSKQNTSEQKASEQSSYTNLEPEEMAEKMRDKKGIVLDVRTPEETAEGVIEGATAIDYYRPDFSEKLESLSKDQPIFVYCAAGGRSSEAAKILVDKGYKEVYNLSGGMGAWKKSGMPTKPYQP